MKLVSGIGLLETFNLVSVNPVLQFLKCLRVLSGWNRLRIIQASFLKNILGPVTQTFEDYVQVHCAWYFISLHIRSMWETICDAWACWSGWKFGPNSTEYPYSVIQNTPPPENWNLGRSWDFEYFQLQNTPPPENWNLGRSWDFEYFQLQNTPPPARSSQWETMCSKLPHVETLSNTDNYSFCTVFEPSVCVKNPIHFPNDSEFMKHERR